MRAHSQVPGTRGLGDAVQPSSVPPRPSRRPVFPAQNPPGREPSGQSPGLSVPTPKLCAELDVEGGGVCHVCSCWQSIDRNVSCRFVTARPWRWLPRRSRRASPFASGAHARGGGAMVARLRQVLGPAETKPLFSPFRRCPWEADVPDVEIGQVINPHAPPGEEGVLKLLVTFCKH